MPHPQPAELLAGDFPDSLPTGGRIVAAAVLMAIVEHPRPTLILTRRTDTLRRHAGQVAFPGGRVDPEDSGRSEEHTSELQSLMRNSYAVFCLKKKKTPNPDAYNNTNDK